MITKLISCGVNNNYTVLKKTGYIFPAPCLKKQTTFKKITFGKFGQIFIMEPVVGSQI